MMIKHTIQSTTVVEMRIKTNANAFVDAYSAK